MAKTEQEINRILEEFQVVYIDGNPLDDPKPKGFTFEKYDQDYDSGRNMKGYLIRNKMEHSVRKLPLVFPAGMNGEQMKKLLALVDKEVMQVTAFDPWQNKMMTATMKQYHGDLTPEVDHFFWNYELDKVDVFYKEFSVNLVEY